MISIHAVLRAPGLRSACLPAPAGRSTPGTRGDALRTFTGQLSGRVLRERVTTGLRDAGRAPRSNSMVGLRAEGATTAGPPSVIRGRGRRRGRYGPAFPSQQPPGSWG